MCLYGRNNVSQFNVVRFQKEEIIIIISRYNYYYHPEKDTIFAHVLKSVQEYTKIAKSNLLDSNIN